MVKSDVPVPEGISTAVYKLVLWAPTQGHCSRGRLQTTYVDTLCQDSGLRREELRTAMEDQRVWRAIMIEMN